MKKIDRLLITSFIPPFIVTFAIATFVLVMQILWVYIDDIAGKGLGMLIVFELLAYKSVGLAPMALPMAILLSSVMVMGGLAERYELSSFKSAGVSLLRVMRPMVAFGALTMVVSYYCADSLIPVANLKFGSRMHDIQKKKPALSLDAGIFNDDFTDYAIYIGSKGRDGASINNVLIYDHTEANTGRLSEIVAEKGQMYSSEDGRYFVMQLENGSQYSEAGASGRRSDGRHPFVRVSFKTWTKLFDLTEFQLARTNEDLFTSNRAMMSSGQLRVAIDSIELQVDRRVAGMNNFLANYLSVVSVDSLGLEPDAQELNNRNLNEEPRLPKPVRDSAAAPAYTPAAPEAAATPNGANFRSDSFYIRQHLAQKRAQAAQPKAKPAPRRDTARALLPVEIYPDSLSFAQWVNQLPPDLRNRMYTKARSAARSIESQADSADRTLDSTRENLAKFIYELHTKYSLAVVCIIFVFVGAPMGAIVRKGGFGYPILVSIIFFILFIVLTIFCRKIAETFIVPAAVAAWIPCMVLFPIGVWLTLKAMNDSQLSFFKFERLNAFIRRIAAKKTTPHAPVSPPTAG